MEIAIESAGASAARVRLAARLDRPAEAAAWARWTLTLEREPAPGGLARSLAWRLLTRGALVPVACETESRAFHRIQCAALLPGAGLPSRIESDIADARLCAAALDDLGRLLSTLRRLYPEDEPEGGGPLFVSGAGGGRAGWTRAWVADGGRPAEPFRLEAERAEFRRDDEALEWLARRLLGVPALRPGQAEAVSALLSGRDLMAAMPVGAGKSLIVQLAALLSPGTALIVAPLRALLRDQHRRLAELGVSRAGLLSGDQPESTRRALSELGSGRLLVALAAPERLDSGLFREALRGAAEGPGVSFVAVDEAHCAARRGHDWRPGYRALGARLREWSSTEGRVPALAALSGAGSAAALAESERVLGLREPARVRGVPPRRSLSFRVWDSAAPDQLFRLRELLTRLRPEFRFGPGIVFSTRVDGPLGAASVAEELLWSEGIDAAAYTGRAPEGADPEAWLEKKRRAAADFLGGRRGLLCATRAFGLGVDRADVRFTVHLGLPSSLEELQQQAGRAGRDGAPAECWLLLQLGARRRALRWPRLPLESLRAELDALPADGEDDVSRAYAAHAASFPGAEAESRGLELLVPLLGDLGREGPAEAAIPSQDPEALTRALLRLEDAGVLALERRSGEGWRLRRRGGWSVESALAAAGERIRRDYEAIEPARRRALDELVELCFSGGLESALGSG